MKRRNDIQGLRALAVILVILCHLEFQSGAFRGGYIGVDVFFVISGYIITSLLIREYSRNADANSGYGWISLRAFYFRRVKRIIPVASIVLITTVSSSYFLFNSVKAGWIRNDALFASIFLANVNLIQQKTDYFSQSISQSPLEHYWSLSVEEQFYMLIPFLILLAVSFHGISIGNFKIWWERRVITLLSIITLCSFAWSLVQTSNNPQSSYFSTLTRAWEIGAGGLLALVMFQRDTKLSKKNANLIAISSLLVLFTSSFVFDENSRFPGYLALVPVCATSILIFVCGSNPLNIISKLLSLRPIVFVGEISFSLYLWHLPVIMILNDRFRFLSNPSLRSALLISITFVLALVTYRFVEKPCRDYPIPASWESIRKSSDLGQPKMSVFFENYRVRRALIGILCFGFLLGGYKTSASLIYARPTDPPPVSLDFSNQNGSGEKLFQTSDSLPMSPEGQNSTNSGTSGSTISIPDKNWESKTTISIPDKNWESKIGQGIQLKQAPANIASNISALAVDRAFSSKTCKKTVSADFQSASQVVFCKSEIPNAPLALFVGNSHGAMLQDVVGKSLNDLGYSENGIFTSSCTISPRVIPLLNSTRVDKCKNFGDDISSYIKNKKPEIIIVAEDLKASVINAAGSSVMGAAAASFLTTNLQDSIRNFQAVTSKIILIDAFPTFPKISTCMGPSGSLTSSCVTTTSSTNIYREINKTIASNTGAALISTLPWVCHLDNCPVIIEDKLVSPDGSHISPDIATMLQPLIQKSLNSAVKSFDAKGVAQIDGGAIQSQTAIQSVSSYPSLLSNWKQEVKSGVGNLSIRSLKPSFEESAGKSIFANPDCGVRFSLTATVLTNMNPCLVSGGSKNAVFIGNSHARMLQSMVSKSLKDRGYSTYSLSVGSCGISNITPVVNSLPTKDCDVFRAAVQSLLRKVKPDIIIVSQSDASANNFLPNGISSIDGLSRDSNLYWSEFEKAMALLKQFTNNLIVIGEAPHLPKNPTDCVGGDGKLAIECVGDPKFLNKVVLQERKAVASVKGNYLDIREWLCTSETCPAIIQNTLVYTDISHLTYEIQGLLIPLFTSYISSLGL